MLEAIRAGEFDPDATRSGYWTSGAKQKKFKTIVDDPEFALMQILTGASANPDCNGFKAGVRLTVSCAAGCHEEALSLSEKSGTLRGSQRGGKSPLDSWRGGHKGAK